MISSEVQRTLVKSPPELWTELSDPDALTRHLGELGEIRITRVKPEELVEWEADGTSGTVAIKASGWGTKVTLTVTRELPVTEATLEDPTPEAPELGVGEAGVEEPGVEEPGVEEPAPPVEILAEVAGAAPATPSASTPAPEEPLLADPIPFEPTEPTPAPATEAARRAAGWPPAQADIGAQIENHLGATEGLAGQPSEAPVEYDGESLPGTPEETDASAQDDTANDDGQARQREGFFARLFGRRRRRSSTAPPAHSTDLPAETDAPIPAAEPPVPDAAGLEDEAAVSDPAPGAEAAGGVLESSEVEAEAVLVPGTAERWDDHRARPPATGPGSGELELAAESAGELSEQAPGLDTSASGPVATTPEAREDEAEMTGNDLAAELEAAEETAAEEVTALLTGVLDRLGAAHHRPFSRS